MAQAKKIFFMFPGQGSQRVGMGKALVADFSVASMVFEEASDAISLDLKRICFDDPENQIGLTAITQPALVTASLAVWRVLCQESEISTNSQTFLFAGHSLGEYSALVAANKLSLPDAVRTVRRRGLAMQSAVGVGVGKMAAVIGLDGPRLAALCAEVSTAKNLVVIANDNSPTQKVVAGHAGAVDLLTEKLKAEKIRAIPLKVSAPFHSPLMKPARESMEECLKSLEIRTNDNAVCANVDAKIYSNQYSSSLLLSQIDSPVLWTDTLRVAEKFELNYAIEIGPGNVLSGLAAKTFSENSKIKILATDELKSVIDELT